MPDPRLQSYQNNMLYEGLDQTATNGPPEGELPRSWFDPTTWFSRPEEVLAVVLDRYPGTQYWTDFGGNIIVDVPGIGVRYLNDPGFSYVDAQNLVGNYVMEDNGTRAIGEAAGKFAGGALAASLGFRAGGAAGAATFGPVGGLVGGIIGYGLGTAADHLWIDPARRAALDGLQIPTFPGAQGSPPLQVPPDLVAGVVTTMRGAHRQFVAVTGADVSDREFRAIFEPLVDLSGNMVSLQYLSAFGDYYSELAASAETVAEQQYYLDMASAFDDVMWQISSEAMIATSQPGMPGYEFDARFQGAQPLPGGPGFQLGAGTLADYLGDDPGIYGSMAPAGYPGQAADPWQSVPRMSNYRAIGAAAGVAPPDAFAPPAGYALPASYGGPSGYGQPAGYRQPASYAPVSAPMFAAPTAAPGFSFATPAGASGYGGWNMPATGALRPGSSF